MAVTENCDIFAETNNHNYQFRWSFWVTKATAAPYDILPSSFWFGYDS